MRVLHILYRFLFFIKFAALKNVNPYGNNFDIYLNIYSIYKVAREKIKVWHISGRLPTYCPRERTDRWIHMINDSFRLQMFRVIEFMANFADH